MTRTDAPAELHLGAEELGSLTTGAAAVGDLARAGRVRLVDEASLDRARRLFGVDRAPHCATMF